MFIIIIIIISNIFLYYDDSILNNFIITTCICIVCLNVCVCVCVWNATHIPFIPSIHFSSNIFFMWLKFEQIRKKRIIITCWNFKLIIVNILWPKKNNHHTLCVCACTLYLMVRVFFTFLMFSKFQVVLIFMTCQCVYV